MSHKEVRIRNILEINFAIILISSSGALGRYIDLPVPVIIALRALIGSIFIFLFCKWKKIDFKIQNQDKGMIILSGVLMGLHWVTYFFALKLSNVAVGMISIFAYPVITSFLEPIFLKTKFHKSQILLGLLVLLGIYFLVPNFDFKDNYTKALGLGIISAILYSLRNIISKSKVNEYNGSVLMLYQLIIIAILLFPSYFLMDSSGVILQLPAILVLALLTTALGHTLFLYSFKKFSATSASIISSSQPIYGILIGMIFLNEYPEIRSIIGGILILTSVFMESMRNYKISYGKKKLYPENGYFKN